MNPHISYIPRLLSLFFCFCYLACAPKSGEQVPISWTVTFFSIGAQIKFDVTIRENVQKVTVLDPEDRLVAQLNLGGYARSTESLYFRWEKSQTYQFEVIYQNGESATQTVQAPQTDPRGTIEIAIPYGTIEVNKAVETNLDVSTAASTQNASLVLQGVEMTATVLVRNGLEAPVTFQVVLQVPASFQVLPHNPVWDSEAKESRSESHCNSERRCYPTTHRENSQLNQRSGTVN